MKKQVGALSLCLVGTLIIGIACGVAYANYSFHQKSINRLNSNIAGFSDALAKAQNDMKYSTPNPTTPLEKDYEVNLKVDVGQMYVLWVNMYPELIAQGLSEQDVQQIEEGLLIIDTNILPPAATMDEPASVQRARAWIAFIYDAMYPDNKVPQSNTGYFPLLKSHLSAIATKYRSYKSDSNFQVQ